MPFYLLTNYAKTRTNLSRHLWWVCLVYIGENKPVYVVWKTKKDKAFRRDEFRHQTAQK